MRDKVLILTCIGEKYKVVRAFDSLEFLKWYRCPNAYAGYNGNLLYRCNGGWKILTGISRKYTEQDVEPFIMPTYKDYLLILEVHPGLYALIDESSSIEDLKSRGRDKRMIITSDGSVLYKYKNGTWHKTRGLKSVSLDCIMNVPEYEPPLF